MSSVDVKNAEGKKDGSVELPAHVFDVTANIPLMHQVVVAQQAAARQGTHSTKTRGEVRGGGRKPYRQKGTGRARQGSVRAPQFTGGGVVHGPQPRDYSQRTPKKMKAAALRGALSDRARGGRVHVVSGLVGGDAPSTKAARLALEAVIGTESRGVLVVVGRDDSVNLLSLRNLPQVHLIAPDQLNTYDVLVNDDVIFTSESLDSFLAGPVAAAPSKRRAAKIGLLKADSAPHGSGSHAPLDDVSEAPEGFPIKGNEDSKLYHVPGSAFYDRTVAEVWFATEADAEAAGFALPPSQRKAAEEESK
ncbi:LSU ribosomal protein L4p [Pseudonocardia sp. N23]|nr:LSU ribosomal protein L4p [Pseudonocardia sp. N23]